MRTGAGENVETISEENSIFSRKKKMCGCVLGSDGLFSESESFTLGRTEWI